jgi:glycosyltransferase involved in cell wall biosynthesis
MRVGILSPPWYPVPPSAYGGTELVVSLLTEGLVRAGCEVTLFASGDSRTSASLRYEYEQAPSDRIGEASWELAHVLLAVERAADLDILHDHSGPLGATLSATSRVPVLHTVHGPMQADIARLYMRICAVSPSLALNSISHSQRRGGESLPWVANVPNAIDTSQFQPGPPARDDYLLFLGRMSPDKGAHRAIEVARACERPLLIAAKCREPAERRYFEEQVEPHLGEGVTYLGEASLDEKIQLLRHASATLVPIEWEEPFGLVMIESPACGTPVLATRRGSVPEVVVDGVTGVIVDHHSQMPAALDRALSLDRDRMRAEILDRFDVDRMVSTYLDVYAHLLAARRRPRALPSERRRNAGRPVPGARGEQRSKGSLESPGAARLDS